jgi:hypothetical protein
MTSTAATPQADIICDTLQEIADLMQEKNPKEVNLIV